ncbi:MAG: hypothetical protein WBC93_13495, partial [Sulfitobacter sp.]
MLDKAPEPEQLELEIRARAEKIAANGGVDVLATTDNNGVVDLTLSEALVIAMLNQEVTQFFAIFGHGSTDLGEVLRIYHAAGA